MSGFASGLQAGQNMAMKWIDQYREGEQRRDLEAVRDAKPVSSQGFTSDQGVQLQKAAEQDPFMGFDPSTGAYLHTPAAPDGQTGPMQQQAIKPGTVTDFLGQRTAGEMSPEQVVMARYGAMADVVGRRDPGRGMDMRQKLVGMQRDTQRFTAEQARDARDAKRFGWESDTNERTVRKAKEADEEDGLIKQYVTDFSGSDEQVGATAQYLNTSSKRITMGRPDKDGFVRISVVQPDGNAEFVKLPRQQQATLYAAGNLFARNPTRALEMMGTVNKSLAEAIREENGIEAKVAENSNSVADKRSNRAIQQFNAETQRMNVNSLERYRQDSAAAANTRASNAGGTAGGKDGALWGLAEQVAEKGHFGGNPEKAYEGLKRGQVRDHVKETVNKLELELRKGGMPESEIQQQLGGYLRGQGLPSASEIAGLRSGRAPSGKPYSAEEYARWDQVYPNMTVEDILGGVPQVQEVAAPAPQRGLPPRMQAAPEQPQTAPPAGRSVNGLPASMLDYSRLNQQR